MIWALLALAAAAAPESEPAPVASKGFAVLVAPPERDELSELVFRSAAELTSAGYTARVSPCPPRLEADCPVPPGSDEATLLAVLTFTRSGATLTMSLELLDGHGVRLRRRIGGEPAQDPAAVALHVVELVRASMLRATLGETGEAEAPLPRLVMEPAAPRPPPPTPPASGPPARLVMEPPTPPSAPVPPRPAVQRRIWLGLAASVWQGTGGLGPAVGPTLELRIAPGGSGWAAALNLAVLPAAPRVETPSFSAGVQQEMIAVEVLRRVYAVKRVVLHAAAGGGVYHITVDGHVLPGAPASLGGSSVSMWSAVVTAGGEASISLNDILSLYVGGRVLLAQPYPIVAIAGVEKASAGHPSLGMMAGVRLEL